MEQTTGQDSRQDIVSNGEQRSNNQEAVKATELAEAQKKAADAEAQAETDRKARQEAEFRANFLELKGKYPQAEEFKSEIQQKVSTGYAVEDAIVSTLNTKGKLTMPPTKEDARAASFGGSADVVIPHGNSEDPSFGGDPTKMREELVRLQEKGELGLRF